MLFSANEMLEMIGDAADATILHLSLVVALPMSCLSSPEVCRLSVCAERCFSLERDIGGGTIHYLCPLQTAPSITFHHSESLSNASLNPESAWVCVLGVGFAMDKQMNRGDVALLEVSFMISLTFSLPLP